MVIPFVKMSGAGNDFVLIDRLKGGGVDGIRDLPGLVRIIADRRNGVGADGVIVLGPADGADFAMHYYNADGSTGSLCGNGGRCAASLVMGQSGKSAVRFISAGKSYSAERKGEGVLLHLENPGPVRMDIALRTAGKTWTGHFIDTGSPHLVLITPSKLPEQKEIVETGREIRQHPEFGPNGTNVDFITVENPGVIRVRTYERGVEDETWACGTGAVASAMIHSILAGIEGENDIGVVPLSGETLRVRFDRRGTSFSHVSLEGPATVTFTGTFESDRT